MWNRIATMLSGSSSQQMQAVKPHVPLIKFPPRGSAVPPKEHINSAVGKPDTLDQILNTAVPNQKSGVDSKGPTEPSLDASQIPKKYKRKPLTKEEMEIIEKGGPV